MQRSNHLSEWFIFTVFLDKKFFQIHIFFITEFDGLDLDWEYPAVRGGSVPQDKHRFTLLCRDLKKIFKMEHDASQK